MPNSCPSGKIRYRDRIAALAALASTRAADRKARRNESAAYKCFQCFGWHLTSQSRRRRRT